MKPHPTDDSSTSLNLDIGGMHCPRCVSRVQDAVRGVPGVSDCRVDLEQGSASVIGQALDENALIAAVTEAGYTAARAKQE